MKHHHRPLASYRFISIVSCISLFAAFILLLLVALSLPIIKTVYLLSLRSIVTGQPATSIGTELRFGVWGVCATSVLNRPTLLTNTGECFGPQLGYDIPTSILDLVGISHSVVQAFLNALLVILILHPVAAGLSLVAVFFSLFLGSHALAIVALIASIITALVASLVFAIDLALIVVARSKVGDLTNDGFAIQWGNGVWMVLAAVILTWLGVIFLSARACYCCGVRRKDLYRSGHEDAEREMIDGKEQDKSDF